MAGILDNKSRIIDAYITQEGRRQIAQGNLRINFATFTDATAFYAADVASGSADATVRLYLESSNLPQDQIVFESDDSGKLMPFEAGSDYNLLSGQLISYSQTVATTTLITGSNRSLNVLTGSEFASTMKGIFTGSIDNFQKLYTLGTFDELFGEQNFAAGPAKLTFTLTDKAPIADAAGYSCNINDLESLFSDPRFSTAKNFQYLPPINRAAKTSNTAQQIGNYPPWGGVLERQKAFEALHTELQHFAKLGYVRNVSFDPSSQENNLVGQMFEISDSSAVKLDMVHFGKYFTRDPARPVVDVYFAGKVFVDDSSTQSFVHLFTLVFE